MQILICLCIGWLDISTDRRLNHTTLDKAIAQRPFDPQRCVLVGLLVLHRREECVQPPIVERVDPVVDRDQPRLRVFARFAEQDSVNTTHVSREVLHDHQIELAACDQTIGLGHLLALKAFATTLPFDKSPFDGALISILDPLSEQSLLIRVIPIALNTLPLRGANRGSKRKRVILTPPHYGYVEPRRIDTVCQSA